MAKAAAQLEWRLELSTFEFNLVLRALGGRLPSHEVEKAIELGDDLTAIKIKEIKHRLKEVEKLSTNLKSPCSLIQS